MKSKRIRPKFHTREIQVEYIGIDDLPEDQKKIYVDWMYGREFPMIPDSKGEYRACSHFQDYCEWYDLWSQNLITKI